MGTRWLISGVLLVSALVKVEGHFEPHDPGRPFLRRGDYFDGTHGPIYAQQPLDDAYRPDHGLPSEYGWEDVLDFPPPPEWNVKTAAEPGLTYNKTLVPLAFEPFALGSIKPLGWHRQQLELMAEGLPGRMHEFYRLVRDAPWMGGHAEYSPLNEAYTYYYDGVVPLAYLLDDPRLIDHVLNSTEYLLDHQHDDGWLGPERDLRRRNFWGRYPLFLGLMQLAQADYQREQQILRAMHKFVNLMHDMLRNGYEGYVWRPGSMFDQQWGRSRAADMILVLQWLYEHHPHQNAAKLHDCIVWMYEMAYDWSAYFEEDVFLRDDLDSFPNDVLDSLFPFLHVVNAAQGLKSPAVMRRLTHDDRLLDKARTGVDWTFGFHGGPSGAIYGDERQGSQKPYRGTELCSVVESLFSLNYLYQAIGDRSFADRAEKAAFNALPAMVLPSWWAHQYVAQTNQPASHELGRTPFWNVGPWGQTFGTEPNYPCCAVRFSTGLPKYISASFLHQGGNHIVHALLGPGELRTSLRSHHDDHHKNNIHIKCTTKYPFSHTLNYTLTTPHPLRFSIRIPEWTDLTYSTIHMNNNAHPLPLDPHPTSGLHTLLVPAGTTTLTVSLGANIRITHHESKTISLHHGALTYALPIAANYASRRPGRYQGPHDAPDAARDWTITPQANATWNLAIDASTARFVAHRREEAEEAEAGELPNPIWAEGAPPVGISVKACPIAWGLNADGWAEMPPGEEDDGRKCIGPVRTVELVPYGSAPIRVAQFASVVLGRGSEDLWEGEGEGEDGVGERWEL